MFDMRTLKSVALVLSTGYILVYFSEHLFWARVRPDDSFGNWLSVWIAYSLMAFVFLALVSYFRINNIWALFLAGAVFGWMSEGIVVQTTYEMLPLSISFTGLAWHALITVWIGWYAIRKALVSANAWSILALAMAIGLFYGLWAVSWWSEPDGGVSSIPEFAAYSFVTTTLVILAYWLANWSSSEASFLNRWIAISVAIVFVLYFVFVTVASAPLAIIVLPILLGLAYSGLRRNRATYQGSSYLATLQGPVPIWKFSCLFVLPLTSVLVYSLAMSLDLHWHTNQILYLIATPLGFILFGTSLLKLWRR